MAGWEFLKELKDWQTMIATAIAIIGAIIAYHNVTRQLRQQRRALAVDLMSREEERMERALPGLIEVIELLSRIVAELRALDFKVEAASVMKRKLSVMGIDAWVKIQVPSAEDALRRRTVNALTDLYMTAMRAEEAAKGLAGEKTLAALDEQLERTDRMNKELAAKLGLYDTRLRKFRNAIETHFETMR